MKKILRVLIFLGMAVIHEKVVACDVCGGAASSALFGIGPQFQQTYLSFRWHHILFHGLSRNAYREDQLMQWELQGSSYLFNKVQIKGSLPLNVATYSDETGQNRISGLGDATLSATYTLFQSPDSCPHFFKHFLALGGGIKFPTGSYESLARSPERNMPANFQLGTGSWDYLLRMVYAIRRNNWTVTLDLSSRINTINKDQYLFGDQVGSVVHGMYSWQLPSFKIVPYGGIYFEYLGTDRDRRIVQTDTGGTGTFLSAGCEILIRSVSIGINTMQPFTQEYAQGLSRAKTRLNAQISFLL